MIEYSGDHRKCDNPECFMSKTGGTQDISWNKKCVSCGADLTDAPRAWP